MLRATSASNTEGGDGGGAARFLDREGVEAEVEAVFVELPVGVFVVEAEPVPVVLSKPVRVGGSMVRVTLVVATAMVMVKVTVVVATALAKVLVLAEGW